MRLEGIVKTWNDDRGFGFIEASQGGEEIFVHIKAFNRLRMRPQAAQRVSFQVEVGPQGKKRACNVECLPAPRRVAPSPARSGSAQWGTASLLALPSLLLVLAAGDILGQPPRWALWAYPAFSAITYAAYAMDKAAARDGSWRTSEKTLHLLALLGGWPGALVAQQVLRHKSSKTAFRAVFWATVVLNLLGYLLLASPYGQALAGRWR